MRILLKTILIIFIFSSTSAIADNGLINIKSSFSVIETADRFENVLNSKGIIMFIRINHSENAAKIEENLRPTQLIIFGNPKVGTPLMQCSQSIAIDLPQKVLIYEKKNGEVWLSYNDPAYLALRHNIRDCEAVLNKTRIALSNLSKAATSSNKVPKPLTHH